MNCQWGIVAPKLGLEAVGAGCSLKCAVDARFCETHLRKLAEAAVAGRGDKGDRKYVTRFAEGLVGRLGAALVDHWPSIVAAISAAYVGMSLGSSSGASGGAMSSFVLNVGSEPDPIYVNSSFDPHSDWTRLTVFANEVRLRAKTWEDLGRIVGMLLAPAVVCVEASEFDTVSAMNRARAETLPLWHKLVRHRHSDEAGNEWVVYVCRLNLENGPRTQEEYDEEIERFLALWRSARLLAAVPTTWVVAE